MSEGDSGHGLGGEIWSGTAQGVQRSVQDASGTHEKHNRSHWVMVAVALHRIPARFLPASWIELQLEEHWDTVAAGERHQ